MKRGTGTSTNSYIEVAPLLLANQNYFNWLKSGRLLYDFCRRAAGRVVRRESQTPMPLI